MNKLCHSRVVLVVLPMTVMTLLSGFAFGADNPAEAIAVLNSSKASSASGQNVTGVVRFVEKGGTVQVSGTIQGLNPSKKQAFHVHEWGDCSGDDLKSAGDHYNPTAHPHGMPPLKKRHAGDMGNLEADAQGTAKIEIVLEGASIAGKKAPLLGHAVIVHASEDKGTQPAGDAGARVACGVIGVAKRN